MSADEVTLQLAEADSARVLRAALESWVRLQDSFATYHLATAPIRAKAGDTAEANRHKRQAAVYQRRGALAQQLVDQLPTATTKATP